jgi:hypothetical protein
MSLGAGAADVAVSGVGTRPGRTPTPRRRPGQPAGRPRPGADWEKALRVLADAEAELARREARRPRTLTLQEKTCDPRPGRQLHRRVGRAQIGTAKELLHTLLDDVIIRVGGEAKRAELVLRWRGGPLTVLAVALLRQAPPEFAPARKPSPSSAAWPSSTPTEPSADPQPARPKLAPAVRRSPPQSRPACAPAFAPRLLDAGLRGSNGRFELPSNDHWAQLGFQKSAYSDGHEIHFTVNLSIIRRDVWAEQVANKPQPRSNGIENPGEDTGKRLEITTAIEWISAPTAARQIGCATAYLYVNTPYDRRPKCRRSRGPPDVVVHWFAIGTAVSCTCSSTRSCCTGAKLFPEDSPRTPLALAGTGRTTTGSST